MITGDNQAVPTRVHVFGDTGGHGHALYNGLLAIGLDPKTLLLPPDMMVIHVGDLIHKGPNSNEIIEFVDKLVVRNRGRWIQLFGNHESQHLPQAPRFWRCDCDELTVAILNRWLKMGEAYYAHALPGENFDYPGKVDDRSILFTHAGSTWQFWNRLENPVTAFDFVSRLNKISKKDIFKPGMMLIGGHQTAFGTVVPPQPGPVWALSTFEVYESWRQAGATMPFVQVHGHTTAYGWMSKRWWPTPDGFIRDTTLDKVNRVSTTHVAGASLLGVDPGFSERVDLAAQPYLTFTRRS